MINKKGTTITFWIETIILVALFLVVVGIMGADMNARYDKSYDTTMGLNLSSHITSMQAYKTEIINQSTSGQTSITDYGVLKLTSIPSTIMGSLSLLWSFASGGFLYSLVMAMNLGEYGSYIAGFFQMLYIITIVYILIKLALRTNI